MGGYKKHNPTVYAVAWADGVVKVGFSARQRWRKFELNGASVLCLIEFDNPFAAFDFEGIMHDWMLARFPLAFTDAGSSEPYMGPDRGGYRECYRVGGADGARAMLEHMREHLSGTARIVAEQCTQRTQQTQLTQRIQDSSENTYVPDAPTPVDNEVSRVVKQRRLTGSELLDEVQWLLDGGVHPLMVCTVLGKSLSAIAATAVRLGDGEVARVFSTVRKQERERVGRRAA